MSHEKYQACIDACNACAAACDHCSVACLSEPDVKHMADCIRLDMDCAQICRLAAGSMARGSACVTSICRLCAEVCDACAQECGQHEAEHCQRCAQRCRQCAEECRKMAA